MDPATGNWIIICPVAFASGGAAFPQTSEERATAYYNLPFPRNVLDFYDRFLVGTFMHEMHHAIIPGSESTDDLPSAPLRFESRRIG